jgi:hypothetical protein
MRLRYSERLRSNYLVIENGHDQKLTADHVIRTARLHRCARFRKGRTLFAISFRRSDGSLDPEIFVSESELRSRFPGLTSVA